MKLGREFSSLLLSSALCLTSQVSHANPGIAKALSVSSLLVGNFIGTSPVNAELRGFRHLSNTPRDLQIDPDSVEDTLALGSSTSVSKTITTSAIPQNLEFCLL